MKNLEFFSFRLSESETKTTMHVFSDHAGVVIDPFGIATTNENTHVTAIPDLHGVRISPRQSPNYEPMVNKKFKIIYRIFVVLFLVNLWSNNNRLSISSYSYNMVAIRL